MNKQCSSLGPQLLHWEDGLLTPAVKLIHPGCGKLISGIAATFYLCVKPRESSKMGDPPGLMSPIYPHVTGGTGLIQLYIYRHSCKILYIFVAGTTCLLLMMRRKMMRGCVMIVLLVLRPVSHISRTTTSSEASVPY